MSETEPSDKGVESIRRPQSSASANEVFFRAWPIPYSLPREIFACGLPLDGNL